MHMPAPVASTNIPIIFSVTGHRDIVEPAYSQIRDHLTSYFLRFKETYNNTNIMLISAMAEGGDRLAAKAALDAGIMTVTVLPMEKERYELTFTGGPDALNEFNRLVSTSSNNLDPVVLQDQMDEVEQYRALGRYLVSNSHILISLWDGEDKGPNGGASDVTKMAILGIDWGSDPCIEDKISTNYLDIVDTCPVYHVLSPRGESTYDSVESTYILPVEVSGDIREGGAETYELVRSNELPERYAEIFDNIEKMNTEMNRRNKNNISSLSEEIAEMIENGETFYMLPNNADETELNVMESPVMKDALGRYAAADKLAMKYQKASFKVKNAYLALVTLSSILLMLYLMTSSVPIVAVYAILMTFIMVMYWYVTKCRKREYHAKFIEYRNLAEIMRVHYYWSIAKVVHPISDIFPEYLRRSTEKIRGILTGWMQHTSSFEAVSDIEGIRLVREAWIRDQEKYHLRKKELNGKRIKFHESMQNILTGTSILASVAAIVVGLFSSDVLFGIAVATLLFALNVVVSISGVFSNTESTIIRSHIHGGTEAEIDLKQNMFKVAGERIDRLLSSQADVSKGTISACREIIYELGLMSIEECSDWASTHVSKDISSPMPGKT